MLLPTTLRPGGDPGAAQATRGSREDIWILEEAAGHLRGSSNAERQELRLYRVRHAQPVLFGSVQLRTGVSRFEAVQQLMENVRLGTVVANHRIVRSHQLISLFEKRGLSYVVEVSHNTSVAFSRVKWDECEPTIADRIERADWRRFRLVGEPTEAYVAALGQGTTSAETVYFFALSIGGIPTYRRGILVGATNIDNPQAKLSELGRLLASPKWLRVKVRAQQRKAEAPGLDASKRMEQRVDIPMRANRRLASKHDLVSAEKRGENSASDCTLRGVLAQGRHRLNVVELFSGAGGMGLGFLLAEAHAAPFAITASAEIHPIYIETLKRNHHYLVAAGIVGPERVPSFYKPLDLCSQAAREEVRRLATEQGPVDIVIGGPPCQGFSNSNRNSWSPNNPNNRLVDAFLDSIQMLRPRVLLMENVQGILWTPHGETQELSVAAHVVDRLAELGYGVHAKLLDAVWYGVPQNRNRFFLLGIHKDLGYKREDFGSWGPFPRPTHGPGTNRAYVSVKDAIGDLPRIGNGASANPLPYDERAEALRENAFLRAMRVSAPTDFVWDHVTSRHADYVIERYSQIPPGENWSAVRHLMTNYADVERTHSNIYRRLRGSEPAITIGHYRKSMIVHPRQHRGLSLREAARLQSFPDWFRFAGGTSSRSKGLMHQQQQLANAVCPLVTKAVAEFILQL